MCLAVDSGLTVGGGEYSGKERDGISHGCKSRKKSVVWKRSPVAMSRRTGEWVRSRGEKKGTGALRKCGGRGISGSLRWQVKPFAGKLKNSRGGGRPFVERQLRRGAWEAEKGGVTPPLLEILGPLPGCGRNRLKEQRQVKGEEGRTQALFFNRVHKCCLTDRREIGWPAPDGYGGCA